MLASVFVYDLRRAPIFEQYKNFKTIANLASGGVHVLASAFVYDLRRVPALREYEHRLLNNTKSA